MTIKNFKITIKFVSHFIPLFLQESTKYGKYNSEFVAIIII